MKYLLDRNKSPPIPPDKKLLKLSIASQSSSLTKKQAKTSCY